ncbi:MAG: TSUP family transporter [Gammaproteobacteria bacterium]|nr:TSUP family transporter [Gammaproteobacteria bacterium]NIM74074.1 TSUP family transporter [Gammaproteobacteria bacterium]NIN38957.1 TSUP family transporter [Gammaproteobacteria bacterium]NIO25850.1 TSUP family transporter [Gammaproteobacteria bacterium]NIO66481.1 TSUP family transporter [Gammaproteobacteria bacterium]
MSGLDGLAFLVGIGLLVGVLIGCIGIGGVLLVPSLTYVGGMEVHVAIATCMFSYLFSGAVGAVAFARRGSIRWSMSGWLCVGAMPGAYLGAVSATAAPAGVLELLIAALAVLSGGHALMRGGDETASPHVLQPLALVAIGAVTGYGSAMSGTGGPLLLVPMLVWLKVPMLTAVGLSQVIQLPIATLASVGNLIHGRIDIIVALGIAGLLMLGVALGARIAHWVPAHVLRRIVAIVLIAVGATIAVRLLQGG